MILAAEAPGYTPLWIVLAIAIPLAVIGAVGLIAALHELNPDPGWRAREAEIRRLEQEKRLRELRDEP